MNSGGILVVTGGVHAGASMLLSDGHELTIGSGAGATLVLVDDDVAPHHATATLRGDVLQLNAVQEGVSIFGYPLAPGKATALRRGASFAIGNAQLQFSGRDVMTPEAIRQAELVWLMTHAPLGYVAKRWALAPRGARITLLLLLVSAAAAALWRSYAPRDVERKLPDLGGAFRYVTVREDKKTHAYIYEGYVLTSPDLASLVAKARSDTLVPTIRVIVVDQAKEQLADFLQKYYHGVQIKPGEPGSFVIVPPVETGYVLPESWDYRRIARLARESINGLRDIRFEGHAIDNRRVRVPLEVIGMNLAHSAHGAWLVDQKGVRYFPGARLPMGALESISGCTATLIRDDDGTAYEFFVRGDRGKKCRSD